MLSSLICICEYYGNVCFVMATSLGGMVGCFIEMYMRRDLRINADRSKMMVLGREEEFKREIHVDEVRLEQV